MYKRQISQCLVGLVGDSEVNRRLVAYIVPVTKMPTSRDMRSYLEHLIPDYMIPHHFVSLSQLPRLPNGKIDRSSKILQSVDIGSQEVSPSRANRPLSEVEKQLADVWNEILHISDIGPEDNFFDLGGHSLLVMQVISRMEQIRGTRMPPRNFIFENLEQLANSYSKVELSSDPASAEAPSVIEKVFKFLKRGQQ